MTDSDKWIARELDSSANNPMTSIQLLVGEAGFGKSIYAFQMLKNYLNLGGYGLWMPPSHIENSSSLAGALEKHFQELNPRLELGVAEDLKGILSKDAPLLIVVDDINRNKTGDPTRLLEKLLLWSRDPEVDRIPYRIVCPVWPRFLERVKHRFGVDDKNRSETQKPTQLLEKLPPWFRDPEADRIPYRIVCEPRFQEKIKHRLRDEQDERSWVSVLDVGPMTASEAVQAIQKATISTTTISAEELAHRLGYDPFLIGIICSRSSVINAFTKPETISQQIVKRFINDKILDVCVMPLVASDYHRALAKLVSKMLRAKNLLPTWPQIKEWFQSDHETQRALEQLSQSWELCRIDPQSERFLFRHDRILEAIAVDSISKDLEMSAEDIEVLCEPYYAEWVGHILAQSQVNDQLLEKVMERSPLALVEAIRWFEGPVNDFQQAIVQLIKSWMSKHQRKSSGVYYEAIRDSILLSLLRMDSPVVLDITDRYFADNLDQWRLLARFRNGCTQSGIEYCSRFGAAPMWTPSPYGSTWYQIVEHAKQKHSGEIVHGLQECCAIPDSNDRIYKGALLLAAFIGIPALVESIMSGWQEQSDKMQFLAYVVIACVRCYSSEHTKLLEPLVAYWAELPDVEESEKASRRDSILTLSPAILSFGLSEAAISYLLTQAKNYEVLKPAIAPALRTLDHPGAVEFVIRVGAEIEQLPPQADWVRGFLHYWQSAKEKGYSLSSASTDKLKTLWENQGDDERARNLAFQLWLITKESVSLDLLKSIPTSSVLFPAALKSRMYLGDKSVVQELLPILSKEVMWFGFAHYVWCNELMEAVNENLVAFSDCIPKDYSGGKSDEHFIVSELLTRIPENDAEQLLVNNWEHLGYSGLFILAALYIGTPKCLLLADRSITSCPVDVEILQYWQWIGGRITLDYLRNLEPYLERFDDTDIGEIARICENYGEEGIKWRRKHLLHILENRKTRHYYEPTFEELVNRLAGYAKQQNPYYHLEKWLKDFKKLETDRKPLEVLELWFASNPTYHNFVLLAAYIELIGTREDLTILDRYTVEYGHLFNIDWIKKNTRFAVERRTLQ